MAAYPSKAVEASANAIRMWFASTFGFCYQTHLYQLLSGSLVKSKYHLQLPTSHLSILYSLPIINMRLLWVSLLGLGIVAAAPARPFTALAAFKTEILNPILEEMCLDMSATLCTSEDGHKVQYAVYDASSKVGQCRCSDLPSQYIVSVRIPAPSDELTSIGCQALS